MSDNTQPTLRFQVWRKLDNEQPRALVAAFADYLDAVEYAEKYEGEFNEAAQTEIVSL